MTINVVHLSTLFSKSICSVEEKSGAYSKIFSHCIELVSVYMNECNCLSARLLVSSHSYVCICIYPSHFNCLGAVSEVSSPGY